MGPTAEAEPGTSAPVLIDAATLRVRLDSDSPPVLLDVRWTLGDRDGERHYRAAHIPGAVYVDLESELSGPPSAADGRHPLPSLDALQLAARRWGITRRLAGRRLRRRQRPRGGACLVAAALGGRRATSAARWRPRRMAAGRRVRWSKACARPRPGDVVLTGGRLPLLDADHAAGSRARVCCSTRAPASATAARSSRSTRGPVTSPVRSARRRARTCVRTAPSLTPRGCGRASGRSALARGERRRCLLRLRGHGSA